MDIQSYLKQARYLDLRINMKLMQLTALRRQVLAADPDGGGGRAAALEDEIRLDIEEMAALKTQIMGLIRRLSRPEYQTIVEFRYLYGWSWEKISANIGFSKSYVREMNSRALRECGLLLKVPDESAQNSTFLTEIPALSGRR